MEEVSDHSIHLTGGDFEGVIFTKAYEYSPFRSVGAKFTPDKKEIMEAERLLERNLDTMENNWGERSTVIPKNLKHYLFQYFGLINERGEKLIYVNALWRDIKIKEIYNRWLTDFILVHDGGEGFWNIKVNLSTNKLFDFKVNPGSSE